MSAGPDIDYVEENGPGARTRTDLVWLIALGVWFVLGLVVAILLCRAAAERDTAEPPWLAVPRV